MSVRGSPAPPPPGQPDDFQKWLGVGEIVVGVIVIAIAYMTAISAIGAEFSTIITGPGGATVGLVLAIEAIILPVAGTILIADGIRRAVGLPTIEDGFFEMW